jgi:hypothetical protein
MQCSPASVTPPIFAALKAVFAPKFCSRKQPARLLEASGQDTYKPNFRVCDSFPKGVKTRLSLPFFLPPAVLPRFFGEAAAEPKEALAVGGPKSVHLGEIEAGKGEIPCLFETTPTWRSSPGQ